MSTVVSPPEAFHTECPPGLAPNGYVAGGNGDWWGHGSSYTWHAWGHGIWSRRDPCAANDEANRVIADAYRDMGRTDPRTHSTAHIQYRFWCKTTRRAANVRLWLLDALGTCPPPPAGWGFKGVHTDSTSVEISWGVLAVDRHE